MFTIICHAARMLGAAMLLMLTVLIGGMFGISPAVAAERVYIIALPAVPGPVVREEADRIIDAFWPRLTAQAGAALLVYDATRRIQIARIEPRGSRAEQQRQRREGVAAVRRFLTGGDAPVPAPVDDLQTPSFLFELGATVRNTLAQGAEVDVMLLGRALHRDARAPSFDMADALVPNDDHLLQPASVSPYGTAGRATALAGMRLHFCYAEQPHEWVSEPWRLAVGRFWWLLAQHQGAQLSSFAPLGSACAERFSTGARSAETFTIRPTGRVAMHPATHRPAEVAPPPPPLPPRAPLLARPSASACEAAQPVEVRDVAILIDTTSSMTRVISDVQENVVRFAERLRALNSANRAAVIAFRDLGDEYVVLPTPFFNLDAAGAGNLAQFVRGLAAAGGGDEPEAVDAALEAALGLPWRHGVAGSIVIIGDAPVRPNRENVALGFAQTFMNSGAQRSVSVIETGAARHRFLRELPRAGGGQHFLYQGRILESLIPAVTGCAPA
jgi:hypothetical protein